MKSDAGSADGNSRRPHPARPVRRYRPRWSGALEAQIALELAALDPLLYRVEEAGCVRAVDVAVVIGQREIAHRTDADHLVAVGVLDHHRPLDDGPGTQDGRLRRHEDRGVEQGTDRPGVSDREGPAGQLVRPDLVVPGALGEIGDLAGDT